ncbi:amino acid ABC transporter permease [Cryobacterium sp. PH31-O1]|uniref:amino acid ABC transporter permease n=1 Tax=Cryobacterium sp. PH31-O1 TaxID=3046306 RepID=UPI0024BBA983|nr:amino acid ABC transporter permease [Cryobacterium sp. PH31-O1]MDJ0336696.1 amino acid ABC transporter permease [Cryobacterium sp. PH31-O1]
MITNLLSWTQYLPALFSGVGVALALTGIVIVLGFFLGLLLAYGSVSKVRLVKAVALVVVEVGRGAPLLVLLYIVYQGLPQFQLTPTAFASAVIAFTWSAGAYSAEVIRTSIDAVPNGQSEAAIVVGMNRVDSFRFIIAPQAIRVGIPPLMNIAIQFFQFTSLAYAITVPEIMQAAYFQATVTFDYFSVFLAAAFLYASITIPTTMLVSRLERHLAKHL